jgi:O-6-methylguanine DNA methyltransferase
MSNLIYIRQIESPLGPLTLAATERGLCNIDFGAYEQRKQALHTWAGRQIGRDTVLERDDARLEAAAGQLRRYFAGELTEFDLPLDVYGTPFQQQVWGALRDIPYGATRSYGDIAKAIGQASAVRAVGGANNRNPLPIVVPCHRVIGAGGELVGYGGGVGIKVRLLALEGHERYANPQMEWSL